MPWNVELPEAEWYDSYSESLQEVINAVCAQKHIALDTETNGLIRWKSIPLYWSLAFRDGVSVRRICMTSSTMPYFAEAFADPDKEWLFANAKFDMHMLANMGHRLQGKAIDTAVQHALLYEQQPHDLKSMVKQILGWGWKDFKDTFKFKKGDDLTELFAHIEATDRQKLIEYASNDAYGTFMLYEALKAELEDAQTHSLYRDSPPYIETLWDLFYKTEVPFTKVLFKMERNGVRINREWLDKLGAPAEQELDKIHRELTKLMGRRINPNSNPQLRAYFIDELGLKPRKMNRAKTTGAYTPSLDEEFFVVHRHSHPACELMLKHRELSKLLKTYIYGLSKCCDHEDRVHTKLNQDVARTGRLSSSDPNLQNIPRPDNDMFGIRGGFVAEDGYVMVVADYEQLEMRLLGAASLEPKLLQIFLSGKDIHTGNVEMVFGVPYETVVEAKDVDKKIKQGKLPPEAMTAELRQALKYRSDIKTIGFGLNYGMKEGNLSRKVGCTKEEANALIEQYMATYPAVRQFYEEAIAEAYETGYAFTLLGRRRYLPELQSSNILERWRAERQATNVPIQGTAADVVKMAMIQCDEAQLDKIYGARLVLQVHDELVWECPKESVQEMMKEAKDWMENPFPTALAVPLTCDIGSGPSWMAAK